MNLAARTLGVLILMGLAASPAQAQNENGVRLTSEILRQVQVMNERGEKEVDLVPVDKAVPGEELVIRVTYSNTGSQPAENIVIVNPVPDEMRYLAGSAAGNVVMATFSVDGGRIFDLPDKLTYKDDQGNDLMAPADLYTHVRFMRTQALAPGQTDTVSFRAVLK